MKQLPKIEKEVPLPRTTKGVWDRVVEEMEPGDSVFLPDGVGLSGLCQNLRKAGFRTLTREETVGKTKGVRVWAARFRFSTKEEPTGKTKGVDDEVEEEDEI